MSRRLEFRTYDRFVDAIRDGSVGGCILRKDERPWRLASHRVGATHVQSGENGAPSVSEFQVASDKVGLCILGPGSNPRYMLGKEMGPDEACVLRPGSLVPLACPAVTNWISLTSSPAALDDTTAVLAGAPTGYVSVQTASLVSSPGEVADVRALVLEVLGTLDSTSEELHPEAAANLDRTLLRALARFHVGTSSQGRRRRALRVDRTAAFRTIFEFVRDVSSEPVYVEDLCRVTGLPERTLRLLFQEQFGESPVRVLRARRLCLAYEALQEPGVGLKQIRRVAGSYGFWHMGQFAADYRALFGERPSDTVRRARLWGPRSRTKGWAAAASIVPGALAAAG